MNYYVKNQKLLITEANLSTQNGFSELNNEQIDFFSRNQNASVDEILNCQLRENSEPALDVVKREKCARVDAIYSNIYNTNFNVASAINIGFAFHAGCQKAKTATAWIVSLSLEKTQKKSDIMGLTTIDDVFNYDITPTSEVCPVTTDELRDEYLELINDQLT